MVIFYVYMRKRAKKSPFYVAYTQIDEETFTCEGKNFAHRLTRICVYVTEPKKSQPNFTTHVILPSYLSSSRGLHPEYHSTTCQNSRVLRYSTKVEFTNFSPSFD